MKTRIKLIPAAFFAVLIAVCALFVFVEQDAKAENLSWTPSHMTYADGVYTAENSANPQPTLTCDGNVGSFNTVEGEFMYKSDNASDAGGAFMGFQIFYGEGQQDYYIIRMYLNAGQYYADNNPFIRVQKGWSTTVCDRAMLTRSEYPKDAWIKIKVWLQDNRLFVWAGDKLVFDTFDFGAVSWKSVNFITSGDEVLIKNPFVGAIAWDSPTAFSAPYGGWSEDTEDGDTVYTRKANTVFTTVGTALGGNAVELDLRINKYVSNENYVCIQYFSGVGNGYNFIYCVNDQEKVMQIGKSDGLSGEGNVNGKEYTKPVSLALPAEEWTKLRAVFYDRYLALFKVTDESDELIAFSDNTYADDVFGANGEYVLIRGFNTDISVKNCKIVTYTPPPPPMWNADDSWEITSGADGDTYYTDSEHAVIWYGRSDISDYNTIEADVIYGEAMRGDGGINLQVNYDGGVIVMQLAPNRQPVNPVIRMFDNESMTNHLARVEIKEGFGDTQPGDTVRLKMTFDDSAIICSVNGYTVYKNFSSDKRTWTRAGVNTFMAPATVKNMKLLHSDIDYSAFGYADFEFSSYVGVSVMSAQNAELTSGEGELVATATGSGNIKITSPVIDEARGALYSGYMPVRNTFLVRMKNNTSADKAVVTFKTDKGGEFVYSKEFDIKPNSEYMTYYFNVDDLKAQGYLKQFAIELAGGNDGQVRIDAVTFEREKHLYDYAGQISSCIANPDKKTVTVIGSVDAKYNGKTVNILRSSPTNYTESTDFDGIEQIASAKVANGAFTAAFPLNIASGNASLLSSWFLAEVDGVKVSEHFQITNYRDFNDDPPRFVVDSKLTATVTDAPYKAVGDGFTDDTAAIQAAIDAVKAAGGGKVIIPGDDSEYGKRYIVTHLKLCSNLEFEIQKNAVLWQSQREDELNKTVPVHQRGFDTVTYGHDVSIDGLMWCTGFSTTNLPLIFIDRCENVRVTGGGTIRMNDAGGECEDPMRLIGDPGLAVGEANRVHQIPLCTYSSKHIDITDLTLMRSSSWHCYMSFNDDVYVANLNEKEAVCVTADGFTITSCKNVTIDRCFTFTTDDAVGICTAYNDGRGQFYRPTKPGEDNATENIVIRHSFLYGGFGTSWMPWGAAAENMYYQETRGVEVFDCVLGGSVKSAGTWPDDPFYGWSAYDHYPQTEDENYCPIKDVYYHDNNYLMPFDITLNGIKLAMTNFVVTDNVHRTTYSSTQFLNGDFDKKVHKGTGFNDETNYFTGLSYWSNSGNTDVELLGTKKSVTVDTGEEITQPDYAGVITRNGELFQGLYCIYGTYVFSANIKSTASFTLFARDAVTDTMYKADTVDPVAEFTSISFSFSVPRSAVVQIGVMFDGDKSDKLYIDDAVLSYDSDDMSFEIEGETMRFDFENGLKDFTVKSVRPGGVTATGGKLVADGSAEHKILLNNTGELTEFEVAVDIDVMSGREVNCGLYLFARDAMNYQDGIVAYNVQIEKSAGSADYIVKLFEFSGKYEGELDSSKKITASGDATCLRVVVSNGILAVFTDDGSSPVILYETDSTLGGNVGLRSMKCDSVFDNFTLKTSQYVKIYGDKTALDTALAYARKILPSGYTEQSFAALESAIAEANALTATSTQDEIDLALAALNDALEGLVPSTPGSPDDPKPNKTALDSALAYARKILASGYTEQSFAALESAIAEADALTATSTQDEIDLALAALDDALEGLVPSTPGSHDEQGKPAASKISGGGNSAAVITLGVLLGVVTLAAVAMAVILLKKKKTK